MQNLANLVRSGAKLHPDRIALTGLADDDAATPIRTLSYSELDWELDRVARAAHTAGLCAGDTALIALGNHVEFVTLLFGLMRAGIVPAIANPRLGADDLGFIMDDVHPAALFADNISAVAVATAAATSTALKCAISATPLPGFRSLSDFLAKGDAAADIPHSGGDTAFAIYTSGSTGRPKAVLMSHAGCLEHFEDQRSFYDKIYTRPPVNLVAAPLFHKNGTGMIKTIFTMGGTLVIAPRFHPRKFLTALTRHRVTTFSAVATMMMMALREQDLVETSDWSLLDAIMVGAAPTGRVLLDQIEATFGCRVFHMFGTTESGAVLGHDPVQRYTLDSCGRALPGVTVELRTECGDVTQDEGELWVRSPGVALGYMNRPDETAARFRNGWYRTGDILQRDAEGYYFFRGRVDDMFVCGGENIYPLEVERLLLRHPGVRNACVVAAAHPMKGQVPVAFVEKREPMLTEALLKDYSLENGPAFAHPRAIHFVDALPVAPTGKVDRKAVTAMLNAKGAAGMIDA